MNQHTDYPKVTIVGAGNVGANAGLLLAMKNIANVVLIDVAEGIARGKALDIMHMRSNETFAPVVQGTGDYADTANSDIVVVTAGVPRKPGMTREDLLEVNSGIVRSVLEGALPASPNALYVFVTNPLDVMTNLAYSLASNSCAGVSGARLMGMGGVLDTARFVHAICAATGAEPADVDAMVIGAHGEGMLPLPRLATVKGTPLPELLTPTEIDAVVAATIGGGAAVVDLLKTGSAFYAPASSIALMVEELLHPTGAPLSVCAHASGEYDLNDVHICVPCVLGTNGVERIVELELEPVEHEQLHAAAMSIKQQVASLS